MSDVPFPKALAERPRLRQSLLSRFDQCGLAAHFDLAYGRGWSSHAMARGSIAHRVHAMALEEMARMGEEQIEVDVKLALLHEALRQEGVDDFCHEPGCANPARIEDGKVVCEVGHTHHSSMLNIPMHEVRDLYWICIKWARDNTFDIANLVDVEKRLEAIVRYPNPNGGFVERTLTGALDALFLDGDDPSHAIVLDWKTDWAVPAPTQVSFEGYFQQRFYGFLVMRNYPGIQRVTMRERYDRFSEVREATLERDALENVEDELAALAERFDRSYETGVWPPTPGRHCSYCIRPAACPIPTFARGVGRIESEEIAAKVAAQLTVANAVREQANAAIKAWCGTHGDIPVADAKGQAVYGYRAAERKSKPDAETVHRAFEQGIDPATLYKTATGTKFGLWRVEPDDPDAEMSDEEILAQLEASTR